MKQNMELGLVLGWLAVLKFMDWAVKYATFEGNLLTFSWTKQIEYFSLNIKKIDTV